MGRKARGERRGARARAERRAGGKCKTLLCPKHFDSNRDVFGFPCWPSMVEEGGGPRALTLRLLPTADAIHDEVMGMLRRVMTTRALPLFPLVFSRYPGFRSTAASRFEFRLSVFTDGWEDVRLVKRLYRSDLL